MLHPRDQVVHKKKKQSILLFCIIIPRCFFSLFLEIYFLVAIWTRIVKTHVLDKLCFQIFHVKTLSLAHKTDSLDSLLQKLTLLSYFESENGNEMRELSRRKKKMNGIGLVKQSLNFCH